MCLEPHMLQPAEILGGSPIPTEMVPSLMAAQMRITAASQPAATGLGQMHKV